MISEIKLIGFKSFLSREIELNQLTVLTGLTVVEKVRNHSSIIDA